MCYVLFLPYRPPKDKVQVSSDQDHVSGSTIAELLSPFSITINYSPPGAVDFPFANMKLSETGHLAFGDD